MPPSPTLTNIRADLATALATISGIAIYSKVPDSIEVPCAVVGVPEEWEYDVTLRSNVTRWAIPVRVYVSRIDALDSEARLDAFLAASGSSSIRAAINAGAGPASGWSFARCGNGRGYGSYTIGAVDYLGAEFLVGVVTS